MIRMMHAEVLIMMDNIGTISVHNPIWMGIIGATSAQRVCGRIVLLKQEGIQCLQMSAMAWAYRDDAEERKRSRCRLLATSYSGVPAPYQISRTKITAAEYL